MPQINNIATTPRGLSSVTIVPISIDAQGNYTELTGQSLNCKLAGVEFSLRRILQQAKCIQSAYANYIPVKKTFSMRLIEYLVRNDTVASPTNLLNMVYASYSMVKIVIQRAGRTWTFYGTPQGYREALRDGVAAGEMTIAMVALGADANTSGITYA